MAMQPSSHESASMAGMALLLSFEDSKRPHSFVDVVVVSKLHALPARILLHGLSLSTTKSCLKMALATTTTRARRRKAVEAISSAIFKRES
jgi:hypothetical protein